MTAIDFIERVARRFPGFIKQEVVVEDIENLLKTFKEDDIDKIWAEFRDTYDRSDPPKRPHIFKIAQVLGVRPKSGDQGFTPMYKCDCGVEFLPTGRFCPSCKTYDSSRWYVFKSKEIFPQRHEPPHIKAGRDLEAENKIQQDLTDLVNHKRLGRI